MTSKRMERRPRQVSLRIVVLVLGALVLSCQCAPSFNPKPSWREDGDVPVLTPSCNPATGRCWSWLPVADSHQDDYAAEQDLEFDRAQPIHERDVEQEGWQQPSYSDSERMPTGGRLIKKGFAKKEFISRGWNAGGMPFSVLYLVPRKSNQDEEGKAEAARRNGEPPAAPAASPVRSGPRQQAGNNRLAQRNGSTQIRRNYSIIPQLFISYGWGPSGK